MTTTRLQEEYQRALEDRDSEGQTTPDQPTSSVDMDTEGDSDNGEQVSDPSLSFQSAFSRSSVVSDAHPQIPPSRNRSAMASIPETPLTRSSVVKQEPTTPSTRGKKPSPNPDPTFQRWLSSRSPWQATPRTQLEPVDPWVKRRMDEERGRRREERLAALTLQRQVGMALGLLKGVQITVHAQQLGQPNATSGELAPPREVETERNLAQNLHETTARRNEEDMVAEAEIHQAEEVAEASQLRDPTLSQSVYISPASSIPSPVETPVSVASLQPLESSTPFGPTSYSSPVRKRRAFKASLRF